MVSGVLHGLEDATALPQSRILSRVGPVTICVKQEFALNAVAQLLRSIPLCKPRIQFVDPAVSMDSVLALLDAGVDAILIQPSQLNKDNLEKSQKGRIVWLCKDVVQAEEWKNLGDRVALWCDQDSKLEVAVEKGIAIYDPHSLDELILQKARKAGVEIYLDRILQKQSAAEILAKMTVSDRQDGLIPTVVCDMQGIALGLVYSSKESVIAAIEQGKGIYQSRKRGLWEKGKTSGATQELFKVHLDCDEDCLRFMVVQKGAGFCHLERRTCWEVDFGIGHLL
jgi:phosphoribosyl-ATP pyrophosphohydrolase/phosphoribosyl-AMP cyclohydrolase/histidinol dehydrogenase